MICQFNTGTDSIQCKNSSLVLKVKGFIQVGSEIAQSGFGTGSGFNIIKNIRIYHRSGTTYCNVQKMNLYRAKYDHISESTSWFSSIGEPLMGYNNGILFSYNDASPEQDDVQYIQIPLGKLHGLFSPQGGCIMPSQISAGLRVEIDTESGTTVFSKIEGAGIDPFVDYEIQDVYFSLDSVALMDSAQASINTTASTQSLEYLYEDVFTSQNSQPSNNSQVNIDINKSVALADSVISCVQNQQDIGNPLSDSFGSVYREGSWWYSLGSLNFPVQKVDNRKSGYHQALVTWDKFVHPDNDSAIRYLPTLANPSAFSNKYGVYAQSLERDTSLALSASPVNASRSLRFELTYVDPPTIPTLVTVFLTYLTSSRSTLLNSRCDI
jgi:hypothetical protein